MYIFALAIALAQLQSVLCITVNPAEPSLPGLTNITFHRSRGGNASCVSGDLRISTSATNFNISYPIPTTQAALTELVLSYIAPGSTLLQNAIQGTFPIHGTYTLGATLCTPKNNITPKAVQVLAHGNWLDRYLWDFAPSYSYVDAAAASNYATFFYDRLGVGQSFSPSLDPLLEVQLPLQVELLNTIALLLRNLTHFERVIGVGHSTGSTVTQAVTAKYPSAFDATILTGYSVNNTGLPAFFTGLNLALANQNQPSRFGAYGDGYYTQNDIISTQTAFFTYPGFDEGILQQAAENKGVASLGEAFTIPLVGGVAEGYTNPIAVVNGAQDLPFCFGDCSYPTNLNEEARVLYPKVVGGKFGTYMAEAAGHAPQLHYSAKEAEKWIMGFLEANGIGS